jgi:hypothetical protein
MRFSRQLPLLVLTTLSTCEAFTVLSQSVGRTVSSLYASPTPEEAAEWYNSELVDEDEEDEDDVAWMPDRELARRKRQFAKEYYDNEPAQAQRVSQVKPPSTKDDDGEETKKRKVYTEEEEELILAMGGTTGGKREPGYLGDCTLAEIATDYSVPVCYLADVLCTWGVPVPINVNERLGDMVLGEQAFAILEAIHTLDIAALQDRYSNNNIMEVCDASGIDMRDAFQMAVKEGWSVPFGVQTMLRVEQEEELVRVLGAYT